ncbi:MAG: tetratricopeptide repeat protein [Granulosicoccus sp.]|nr:tetratricopeptide repeat protein [Granulosicoccus sp.]
MRSSTVKREKLLKPLHIAFIVVLFVVAFVVLVPSQQTFQYAKPPVDDNNTQTVDALDLAYLKAAHSSGAKTGADVAGAVQSLIKEGRLEEARGLVGMYPEIPLTESDRFLMDLELAAADWRATRDGDAVLAAEKKAQFVNLLTLIQHRMPLQQTIVLERVLELSIPLTSTTLSDDVKKTLLFDLYTLLAQRDIDNEAHWLEACGNTLASVSAPLFSLQCYELALETQTGQSSFEIKIAMLRQLQHIGNQFETDKLLYSLISDESLNTAQLESLAAVVLEYERPDLAHPLYGRLSTMDKAQQVSWLKMAARWAEAANEPEYAVAYLDHLLTVGDVAQQDATKDRIQSLLIATGRNEDALNRLNSDINADPDNTDILREAIPVARQLGNDDLALQWNEKLLEREPSNIDAMSQQVSLALGRSDLQTAARWSSAAVKLKPDQPDLRRQHARISEWAGDPVEATYQWQWLAENSEDAAAIDEVVRLSSMTLQPEIAATALRRLNQQQKPSAKQVSRLVEFYELEGQPHKAAEALRELTTRYGADLHVLTELAKLHYRHKLYQQSLLAWQQVRNRIGKSSQETLARIELLWRLNQPERAIEVARELQGTTLISDASDYQVRVISELAWRYREHNLALLVKPMLSTVEDRQIRVRESRRMIDAWLGLGDKKNAQAEALARWNSTGLADFGLDAMRIAFDRGDEEVLKAFSVDSALNRPLFDLSDYWNLRAAAELRRQDNDQALTSYHRALKIDSDNADAVAGLLWLRIGENSVESNTDILTRYRKLAMHSTGLWAPYALAYLQLGDATESLSWFERLKGEIDSDYSLLLSYADALEVAGRSQDAVTVRTFALKSLRPLLVDGSREDQDLLLQQYSGIVTRYASTDEQLVWAQAVLDDQRSNEPQQRFWREDMAIAWLMSTQRHEYARLIMAEIHRNRLEQPTWQLLSLAMQEQDVEVVTSLLEQGSGLSTGDQILALRGLGREREAYALSVKTMKNPPTIFDRQVAQRQYGSLRQVRPSHTTGRYQTVSVNRLGIDETGVSIRHSLFNRDIGYGVDFSKRRFSSRHFSVDGNQEESDIALSLYLGDQQQGGQLTAGYVSNEENDTMYAEGKYHLRNLKGTAELKAEAAYNEKVDGSPELRLAAIQNRASVTLDMSIGAREYFQIGADLSDISTKVERNRIARGVQARAEFGLRGANGSHRWSTSVQARSSVNDRVDVLPSELMLSTTTTMDSLLADKSSMLGVGFTLARGGVGEDYPQSGSPRYYLNASVGQVWPAESLGFQLNAGAGIRVLGGDELGFTLSHDAQSLISTDVESDTTSFGLNYRYHF